jgi:hypothetical protein
MMGMVAISSILEFILLIFLSSRQTSATAQPTKSAAKDGSLQQKYRSFLATQASSVSLSIIIIIIILPRRARCNHCPSAFKFAAHFLLGRSISLLQVGRPNMFNSFGIYFCVAFALVSALWKGFSTFIVAPDKNKPPPILSPNIGRSLVKEKPES